MLLDAVLGPVRDPFAYGGVGLRAPLTEPMHSSQADVGSRAARVSGNDPCCAQMRGADARCLRHQAGPSMPTSPHRLPGLRPGASCVLRPAPAPAAPCHGGPRVRHAHPWPVDSPARRSRPADAENRYAVFSGSLVAKSRSAGVVPRRRAIPGRCIRRRSGS